MNTNPLQSMPSADVQLLGGGRKLLQLKHDFGKPQILELSIVKHPWVSKSNTSVTLLNWIKRILLQELRPYLKYITRKTEKTTFMPTVITLKLSTELRYLKSFTRRHFISPIRLTGYVLLFTFLIWNNSLQLITSSCSKLIRIWHTEAKVDGLSTEMN